MSESRSLKIGVSADPSGVKSLTAGLADLKKKSEDLDKGLKGINKTLSDLGKAVNNIAKSLKDLQKGLGDTSKGTKAQSRDIEDYTKAIVKLNQAISATSGRMPGGRMLGAGGGGGMVPGAGGYGAGGAGGAPWAQRVTPFNSTLNAPPGGGGGGYGGGGLPGGMPYGASSPSGISMQHPPLITPMELAALGTLIKGVSGMIQDFKTTPYSNQATLQQGFRGKLMQQIASGNPYSMSVLMRPGMAGSGSVAEDIKRESGGQGALIGGRIGQAAQEIGAGAFAGGIAGSVAPGPGTAIGAGVGGAGAAIKNVAGAFSDQVNNQYAVTEMKSMYERAEAEGNKTVYAKMLNEHILANAPGRLAAARRLGGGELGIAGAGLGAAMSPQEAFSAATGAANRFGASAVKGGLFKGASGLLNHGFDINSSLGMLGNLQQAAGGSKESSGGQAVKQLETIFKNAFAGGLRDVALAEKIGDAVSGSLFGGGGPLMDATRLGAFYSSGMQGAGPEQIQARVSGISQLGGGSLGKRAPALEGLRAETLKRSMGGSFDPTVLDTLLQASPEELISGSPALKAAGVDVSTPEGKRLAQVALTSSPLIALQRLTTGPGIGNIASGFGERAQKAGGIEKLLKNNPKEAMVAGNLLRNAFGEDFNTLNMSQGLQGLVNGGEITGKGSLGGSFGGGASKEAQFLSAMTSFQQMIDSSKPERITAFANAVKASIDAFNGMKEQVFSNDDANITMNKLIELIKVIQADPKTAAKVQDITDDVRRQRSGARGTRTQ
jgi:hypothetical protein